MPILGFTPGVPSNTPQIVTDCENFIPYEAGMEASPSQYDIGATAVAAAATGAVTITKLDGTRRTFVGTDTKLYELATNTWTDVSQSASAYVSGSVWSFTQFGDQTLAANYGNTIQMSQTSSFSAVVGAPKAKLIESVATSGGGFVFAFNTVDSNYGTSPDRWWCCALNDATSWTVSAATQATTGRLLGGRGEIVAARRFGADGIVAYKRDTLYHGRYVGGDVVWNWQEIPEIGACGLRAVANLGFAHFIVSQDGFWIYDGARPVPIGSMEVREWFAQNVTPAYIGLTECTFDKDRNRVWVFFPYGGSTKINRALVFHVGTKQWGLVKTDVETVLTYISSGVTYDTLSGTMDDQTLTYDSPVWSASSRSLAAFDTNHKLVTYTGTPGASYFTTQDFGDVSKASKLTEAYVSYAARPTTASCAAAGSFGLGGAEFTSTSVAAHDEIGSVSVPGRFCVRQNARFHRITFNFTGSVKVTDYSVKLTPAGGR